MIRKDAVPAFLQEGAAFLGTDGIARFVKTRGKGVLEQLLFRRIFGEQTGFEGYAIIPE